MTDIKKLEARLDSLESQVIDLQENLEALGEANNILAGQHRALLECTAQVIARPDFLKNAPTLFATSVYDLINSASEGKEIPEACKQSAREESDAFFSRLNDLKRLV